MSKTVLALAALAATLSLQGQVGNSAISGFIYDKTQSVIGDAVVMLADPSTGLKREIKSDERGYYKFAALPPGNYNLEVTKPGFQVFAAKGITLLVSQDLPQDVTLEVGAANQQVTVNAVAPMLESESAVVGQVIASRQILDMPLNGRNFLQLASLSSGANPTVLQGSPASFATSVTNRPNVTVVLDGNRESGVSYLLDGIEMRNDRVGALSFEPSIDALAEFKVERGFFEAENGFHPGIVNVVTKSGSNAFHSSAWEFVRNSDFDSRNFFSNQAQLFKQNQFGTVVTGPIIKDKLLFMFDYEGLRQRLGITATGLYPTQRQFSGDLSESFNRTIYDPSTYDPQTGMKAPFPGNIIPSNRINTYSVKAIHLLFPVVSGPPTANNLLENLVQTQTDNQYIGRLDLPRFKIHNFETQMMFHFAWGDSAQFRPGTAPLQGLSRPLDPRNVVNQLTTAFSPRVINVLRMGYQRDYSPYQYEGSGGNVNFSQELGLKNTTTNPADFFAPPFGLAGFSGTGGSYNLQTISNRYILGDDVTLIRGAHTIKTGFEIRYTRLLEETATFAAGSLTFSGQFTSQTQPGANGAVSLVASTGGSIADFLLGFPQAGSAAFGNSLAHFRYINLGVFAQDDWKVTRNLTVQFGLRYEPSTYPAPELKNNYIFDQKTGTLLFPLLGEAPAGLLSRPHREFGPRIGLAWNPSFDHKSTIRAGYGIYFDQTQLNELQFQNYGPPFYNLQTFSLSGTQPLPTYTLGVNTFPNVPAVPIQAGYVPPTGTGPFSLDPGNRTPTVYQWNVNYQRDIGGNWLLESGYFGLHGLHLSKRYDIDTCSGLNDLTCSTSRRPWPNLSQVFLTTTNAWSRYNGLHVRLQKRFSAGFQMLAGYTWQRSIDTDSGGSFGSPVQRAACLICDKGLSNFNIDHRFTSSVSYDLPFGHGRAFGQNMPRAVDTVLGGWEVTAIVSMQTGPPQDVTATNLTADTGIHTQRANCLGGDAYASGDLRSNGLRWLNPANFSLDAAGFYGTCGRSVYTGPGLNNWDLSVLKHFRIRESAQLEFRTGGVQRFQPRAIRFTGEQCGIAHFWKGNGGGTAACSSAGVETEFLRC
jgi:hypothetical protein